MFYFYSVVFIEEQRKHTIVWWNQVLCTVGTLTNLIFVKRVQDIHSMPLTSEIGAEFFSKTIITFLSPSS